MFLRLRTWLAIPLAFAMAAPPACAQSVLGLGMKKEYRLRSVSCAACHDKQAEEKSRDRLTSFGQVIGRLVVEDRITERLENAKDAEFEERDEVKEAIRKEFLERLKQLDRLESPTGKSYAQAIQDGDIDGVKPRD